MTVLEVKPYVAAYKTNLIDATTQRAELLLRLSSVPFIVIAVSALWFTLASQGYTSFGGYTISELIAYALIAIMIQKLTTGFPVSYLVESDITDGTFTTNLCRPIEHWKYRLAIQLAQITITLPIILLALMGILFFTGVLFQLQLAQVLIAIVLLALGALFSFFEYYTVGALAFWLERIWGIRFTVNYLESFIAGTLIPLTIFPPLFQTIMFYLPFSHIIYTPAALLMGKLDIQTGLITILILAFWTIMMFWFSQYVWKKGLAKYDGKM